MDIFEIKRQVFHLSLGLAIIILFNSNLINQVNLAIILIAGITLSIILTRWHVPVISWFIKTFDRNDAKFPGEGAVFYVLGCLIVLSIFEKNIALASIMVLALGDSVATLAGKRFGKKFLKNNKTLEGSLAGAVLGAIGAMIFVEFSLAVIGSFTAMFIEAVEIKLWGKGVDDNLYIPLISALIMYIVSVI